MRTISLACLALVLCVRAASPAASPQDHRALERDIFEELIEIDTTDEHGDNTRAAEAMAARLRAAGMAAADVRVLGPHPRKGNLVARLRGAGGRKPILLLAHLDVVEARREDWSTDPFTFVERDGFYYGRGTSDDKAMAAIFVASFVRYLSEGYKPDRDVILALTADEEGGDFNGVDWLLRNHRDLIGAELAINEGGDGQLKDGKPLLNELQASEKVYQSFRLEIRNAGGHSSLPTRDNAIYRLAAGLGRLEKHDFPVRLNDVTRAFFERMSKLEQGQLATDMLAVTSTPPDPAAVSRLAASPFYNAQMRTTCVPTRLDAGHAENALPQMARAIVNCRMLPGESPEAVRKTIAAVLDDQGISVTPVAEARPSPPSPLRPDVLGPIERLTSEMWPGVPVVPVMVAGATDGLYLRNAGIPTYGVSGIFMDVDDVRAHGRDERVGVESYHRGAEFLYRLVKMLSSAARPSMVE
jgi:acetylornithine deacetylase/succinyl-diaminopimelate desuccinylase-like protein